MIGLLVAYGYDDRVAQRWNAFAESIGVAVEDRVVVDNRGGDRADLTGTNAQFEFSGYLEGLRFAGNRRETPERIVIFNDTLFGHHWAGGWARLVARVPSRPGIWGDGRRDRTAAEGWPARYVASWHFDLVGQQAIQVFVEALEQVVDQFDEPDLDPTYEIHLERYLKASHWRGYSNPASVRDGRARERKLACIRAEHRLSSADSVSALLQPYRGPTYRAVHAVDRGLSARRRIASLRRI